MSWCSADSLQERYCNLYMGRDKEMKIGQSNNKNDNLILCQTELSSQWSRTRDGINVLKQRTSPAQY